MHCLVPRVLAFRQGFLDRMKCLSTLKVYVAAVSALYSTVDGISLGAHKTVNLFEKSQAPLSTMITQESSLESHLCTGVT